MDWIDKWNEALEMLEKSLTAEFLWMTLPELPAAQPFTFSVCFPIWQICPFRNISAAGK